VARLLAVVDSNGLQSDDHHSRVCNLEPLADRWRAFGWRVREADGHDPAALGEAFELPEAATGAPTVVLAHTVKGRGVSFMEGSPPWHGSVRLSDEDLRRALGELGAPPAEVERWLARDR
ncbi:MAG: transketolase, partial [Nitrospirae bacterium]